MVGWLQTFLDACIVMSSMKEMGGGTLETGVIGYWVPRPRLTQPPPLHLIFFSLFLSFPLFFSSDLTSRPSS